MDLTFIWRLWFSWAFKLWITHSLASFLCWFLFCVFRIAVSFVKFLNRHRQGRSFEPVWTDYLTCNTIWRLWFSWAFKLWITHSLASFLCWFLFCVFRIAVSFVKFLNRHRQGRSFEPVWTDYLTCNTRRKKSEKVKEAFSFVKSDDQYIVRNLYQLQTHIN